MINKSNKRWHMNRVNDDQSKVVKRARRNTLGDILTRTAARVPNKQAFIFRNRQITYEGLDELVDEIAFGLVNEGIKKGDRLAILSKNRSEERRVGKE